MKWLEKNYQSNKCQKVKIEDDLIIISINELNNITKEELE